MGFFALAGKMRMPTEIAARITAAQMRRFPTTASLK